MIQAEVKGIEELDRRMKELATTGVTKAASKGMRAALKIIEKAQAAAAPVYEGPPRKNSKGEPIIPGKIKRSIGSRFAKGSGKSKDFVTAKAGINVKARKSQKDKYAPHYAMVTVGTRPRWAGVKYIYGKRVRGKKSEYVGEKLTGKRVRYTGIGPPNAFIRLATESVETQAVAALKQATLAGIEAEARKAGR